MVVDIWTPWRTEEYGKATCEIFHYSTVEYIASGNRCKGGYCDDVSLACDSVQWGYATAIYYTPWFSEEQGYGGCPYGYYVVEIFCSGRYCDNISFQCMRYSNKSRGSCWWGGWYSEEQGGRYAAGNSWLAGMQCSGRFCDNKRNLYCY